VNEERKKTFAIASQGGPIGRARLPIGLASVSRSIAEAGAGASVGRTALDIAIKAASGDAMKLNPCAVGGDDVPSPRLAYRVGEACAVSGIGRTALYDLIKSGKLVARKCGRRTVILVDDLAVALENLPKSRAEAR
jgi:hypothetical protein